METRLRSVFVSALGLSDQDDVHDLRQRQGEWDSLGHMALVAALETEFVVELDTDQVIEMDTFEAALNILQKLGISNLDESKTDG
ncbi:acyl carrier protein [Streptomyces silvisoli]|uniref:Acyl carrier protein n=1 Tax=Streptomyces silvisoli TaxID=3034235 RepID=A0ABT5ZKC1_9ACTN|nr:acyl carrier protein [Streptomyces silvisoli]MDF3290278.1 acyl carrier protein [Streptomyces silvisoli]